MQALLFIYIGGGLLLAALSLLFIAGNIKPNPYYGFRAPLTLENPEIWYAANTYFAKRQLVVALIEVATAICNHIFSRTCSGYNSNQHHL